MRAIWVGILLLLMGAAHAADFDPALVDAARKEGVAVWYTGLIVNQISRPMAEAFEARFPGIKVQYSRASNTDTTLKLLNEARARRVQADVVDVTSGIHALTDAKLLAAYRAKAVARYPDVLKDKAQFALIIGITPPRRRCAANRPAERRRLAPRRSAANLVHSGGNIDPFWVTA